MLHLWQDAFEWTFYDQVLGSITSSHNKKSEVKSSRFQALFCIDDRECSLRRYVEDIEPQAQTYGTPGFWCGLLLQTHGRKVFHEGLSGTTVSPYLIKEVTDQKKNKRFSFCGLYTFFVFGWLITHTIGFWSAIRLFINIFTQDLARRPHYLFATWISCQP